MKVFWKDVRDKVALIEPQFARIVDELDPDKNFPMYLAYYPYGAVIADSKYMYLPNHKAKACTPLDHHSPEVIKHLGYGKDNLAMGMVLEKNIEVFIDFKNENSAIPWLIYKPGTIFPYARTLSKNNKHTYAPNNILTIVSGARSVFMLPHIGSFTNHVNLQRDLYVQSPPPKMLYEHWNIFKEITESEAANCKWKSCLLYFSETWVEYLHNDPSWLKLKMYIHELAWNNFDYRRNNIFYNIAFSKIQRKRNLKPNPYLIDTASHLFTTALGAAPGYAPSTDDSSLPLSFLQNIYINSYGMKKYLPIIMQPVQFDFEKDPYPVYYSFQHPATFVFSPKARKMASVMYDLHELDHIMKILVEELSQENTMCAGTIISEVAKNLKFEYYHNEPDTHRKIKLSSLIGSKDERFNYLHGKTTTDFPFPADAKFLRGCIMINPNNKKPQDIHQEF